MVDTVSVSENVKGGYVRRSVVGDDDFYGSVAAEDIFENELGDGCRVFGSEHLVFRPGGEGASCLSDIGKSAGRWHFHGVHVYDSEETSGLWNGRRNV